MKKTVPIIFVVLFTSVVSGLQFSDEEVISGEVNRSPPMPGENFSIEVSDSDQSTDNVQSITEDNSSTNQEAVEALEDDSEDRGFVSKVVESLSSLVPFL